MVEYQEVLAEKQRTDVNPAAKTNPKENPENPAAKTNPAENPENPVANLNLKNSFSKYFIIIFLYINFKK